MRGFVRARRWGEVVHVETRAARLGVPLAVLSVLFLCAADGAAFSGEARALTFEQRVEAQSAIERVYYAHQIGATLPFEQAIPRALLEKKVRAYLKQSVALETIWKKEVTPGMLHQELERMASGTRMPERLLELYAALGDDPFLIEECLARPALVERLARDSFAYDRDKVAGFVVPEMSWDGWWNSYSDRLDETSIEAVAPATEALPLPDSICLADDTWDNGSLDDPNSQSAMTPSPRSGHTAIWTGSRVVVWGGDLPDRGVRYDPALDTWTPVSATGAPSAIAGHSAIWSGSQMLVFGGITLEERCCIGCCDESPCCDLVAVPVNDGGRYDPTTDTWSPISAFNAPSERSSHTAVWTGHLMVVWGGHDDITPLNTGGRYDPATDTWSPISTTNAPSEREFHTAVWTGSQMVVWGGRFFVAALDSGGRYDPDTDAWTPTSSANAPSSRFGHTAVWTGSQMVVWGGHSGVVALDSGGRYDPDTDAWTATSSTNAPSSRSGHTAVWTGSEMIVWGGGSGSSVDNGGRYEPAADTWTPTSSTNAPSSRSGHTAVWTGSLMVIWGGSDGSTLLNTGGRYALGHAVDDDGDGFYECQGDCNDGNADVHPGEEELCNGLDDNCDGSVDEGSPPGGLYCTVPRMYWYCAPGVTSCAAGPLTCITTTVLSAEVCDGVDNDCNGSIDDNAKTPLGSPSVVMVQFGQTAVIGWGSLPDATGYDIVRGSLQVLGSTGGDFTQATQVCLKDDLVDTALVLSGSPAPGSGFFYLVRATNCGGGGTYDSVDPGQVGLSDAEIAASSGPCP